jgi:hypothetical protein
MHRRGFAGESYKESGVFGVRGTGYAQRLFERELDHVAKPFGLCKADRANCAGRYHVNVGILVVGVGQRYVWAKIERKAGNAIGGADCFSQADAV